MAKTNFIIVSQNYKTRQWHVDGYLLDDAAINRAKFNLAMKTKSTHPVAEILRIEPAVDCFAPLDTIQISQPKNGGEFYTLPGYSFELLSRSECQPYRQF